MYLYVFKHGGLRDRIFPQVLRLSLLRRSARNPTRKDTFGQRKPLSLTESAEWIFMNISWNRGAPLGTVLPGGSARRKITSVELPDFPFLLTFARNGELAVTPGDRVRAGQPLDRVNHAPFSGTVASADEKTIRLCCDGEETLPFVGYHRSLRDSDPSDLLAVLAASGIPGSRGGLLSDELSKIALLPIGEKERILVLNIAGQEPGFDSLLRSVLAQESEAVVGGLKIVMKITSARKAIFVLPDNDVKLLNLTEKAIAGSRLFRVAVMKNASYPAAEPRCLISVLSGHEYPPECDSVTALLQKSGMFTITPELCAEVYYAFSFGIPYLFVPVFVGGSVFGKPRIVRFPIGLSFSDCVECCGGSLRKASVLVSGKGPMSGREEKPDGFLLPADRVLLASTPRALGIDRVPLPCDNCGRCTRACPAYLVPPLILKAAESGKEKAILDSGALYCLGCGTCTAVCPAGIPVAAAVKKAKAAAESVRKSDPHVPEETPTDPWKKRIVDFFFEEAEDDTEPESEVTGHGKND